MNGTISTEMLVAIISGIVIPIAGGFIGMFLKMNAIAGNVDNLKNTMDLRFEAVGKQVGNVQELMLQRVQQNEKDVEDLRRDKHDDRTAMLQFETAIRDRMQGMEDKIFSHIGKENDKLWEAFKDYKEWSQKNFTNVSVCQAVHPQIPRS